MCFTLDLGIRRLIRLIQFSINNQLVSIKEQHLVLPVLSAVLNYFQYTQWKTHTGVLVKKPSPPELTPYLAYSLELPLWLREVLVTRGFDLGTVCKNLERLTIA